MDLTTPEIAVEIARRFALSASPASAEPYGGGHINDSFRISCGTAGEEFLLQRINQTVFREPIRVMDNIRRVTAHLAARRDIAARKPAADSAAASSARPRMSLRLVPDRDGDEFTRDDAGAVWRMYRFIDGARTYTRVESPRQAHAAGAAYGEFQRLLVDFRPPRLHDTIPDFHNTPKRYAALEKAAKEDAKDRAASASKELDFAMSRQATAGELTDIHKSRAIPERVVHNDAKIANVLFDGATDEALCVVDLDTVMSGLSLYDFGDMVRSMTTRAPEDDAGSEGGGFQLDLFEALTRGYLSEAKLFSTELERSHMVTAGRIITLEQGVRFLTDYLQGDVYYKTTRPEQNLERCRAQFTLVAAIESKTKEMQRIVKRVSDAVGPADAAKPLPALPAARRRGL